MKLVGRKVALMNNKSEFGHLCIPYGYVTSVKPSPKRTFRWNQKRSQGGLIANWKKMLEAKTKLKEWYINQNQNVNE